MREKGLSSTQGVKAVIRDVNANLEKKEDKIDPKYLRAQNESLEQHKKELKD